VLFAFRHSQEYNTARRHHPPARPRPKSHLPLESIDNKLVESQPQLSGAYLMQAGLNVNCAAISTARP
jgi:hypothetical protein